MRRRLKKLALLVALVALLWGGVRLALPPRPPAGFTTALADAWFAQAYELDEDEVVRLMPPPFSRMRQQRLRFLLGRNFTPASAEQWMMLFFHAGRFDTPMVLAGGPLVNFAMRHGGDLRPAELEISKDIASLRLTVDWVIRSDAPREQRIEVIQDILRQVLDRPILVEKQVVERPALLVRGTYEFESLERGPAPDTIQLFFDKIEDTTGSPQTWPSFLERIGDITRRPVIDETHGVPARVAWSEVGRLHQAAEDEEKLTLLLENISRQTSLQFEHVVREVEVWFVSEESR